MKNVLACSAFALFLLSSCHMLDSQRVKGDGNVVTQSRTVGSFKSVDVSGGIDVFITQDSGSSVKVEIDNNLQEFIEIGTDGDVLKIHQRNNTSLQTTRDRIKVYVSAPVFRNLYASGACSITAQNALASTEEMEIHLSGSCEANINIKAPKVSVDASGACSVTLKGQTRDLDVDGSGSTSIHAFELLSENADIDLSGAGDVEVYASVKLNAGASGSSDIKYKGNASVSSDISGAGSVKKVD